MGVKGLAAWLARTWPDAFVVQAPPDGGGGGGGARFGAASAARPAWARRPVTAGGGGAPASFDCVYVDMASVLHTAMRQATNRGHFAMLVFSRLDALLAATSPKHVAVLALDGPAPLAKLLTQRTRRRRAGRREATDGGGRDAAAAGDRLSSLCLTPGAPLMSFVAAATEYYVCARLASPSPRFRGLAIELSGADVPGEGELKCVARLVAPWAGAGVAAGTHCLVGGDSDLLLMAACAPAPGPVFVMVDDPRGAGRPAPPPGGRGGRGRGRVAGPPRPPPRVFSVAALDAAAARALGVAAPASPAAAAALRRDLTVLAVAACGNDYLPAVGGTTLARAWGAYVRRAQAAVAAGGPPAPPIVRVDDAGCVSLDGDALADVLTGGWDRGAPPGGGDGGPTASDGDDDDAPSASPTSSSDAPSDDDDVRPPADPDAYATGLAWVLSMYVTGACGDYRFTYDGRGPRAAALAAALRARGGAPIPPPTPPRPPLSPRVCAAALLPPGEVGRDAAPPALAGLWGPDSPVADLTAGCALCDAQSAAAAITQRRYMEALHAVRGLTGDEGAAVEARVKAAAETAKDAVRAEAARRRAHVRAAHPYAPFPTARLEAAVAAALGGEEDAFGEAALFWRPVGGRPPPAVAGASAAAARASPCPLPPPPAARLPHLDPARPPVVRVGLPAMVDQSGNGGARGDAVGAAPARRRQRAPPPPPPARKAARPPRKPAAPGPVARCSVCF